MTRTEMLSSLVAVCLIFSKGVISASSDLYTCPATGCKGGSLSQQDPVFQSRPFIDGNMIFVGGKISSFEGLSANSTTPIVDASTGERIVIGRLAQMEEADALAALEAAKLAWNRGQGIWPQMSAEERIAAMETFVTKLLLKRTEIIDVLTWEICKSSVDAAAEFDRTVSFIRATIVAMRDLSSTGWNLVSGITARIRRIAVGIMLTLGPFNYPFNETYATLIPALLAGNVVIMKVPTLGGLAHMLTMEAFAESFPPGVINFVSGSGRKTMPVIMRTGEVDILAFIGGSNTADLLIKEHPAPHRLKIFLQLEGKNLGIVMPDADLDVAVEQIVLGATSYNGQRCTAIKLVMVHETLAKRFVEQLIERVAELKVGLPWDEKVNITPLPEVSKPSYLQALIADAVAEGASVVNSERRGGELSASLMHPAIVYPVTSAMRLWREEQFGPVIPVATYKNLEELYEYYKTTTFGQQAAIFTSDASKAAPLLDIAALATGRINLNTQCGRSPDSLPFSGRRSSALGTMSVTEAFNAFSVEVVVAGKASPVNDAILKDLDRHSIFLAPVAPAGQ